MTAKEFIKEKQSGVLLNDYSLKDVVWFMEKYVEHCNKVYEALHNSDTYEGGFCTISIHKTKKGAEMAMEFHKSEAKKNWELMYEADADQKQEFAWDFGEAWDVRETELKE
jgi:hypothetical protein